jgi:hypothetical protein
MGLLKCENTVMAVTDTSLTGRGLLGYLSAL